jgi:hypothetical protein
MVLEECRKISLVIRFFAAVTWEIFPALSLDLMMGPAG